MGRRLSQPTGILTVMSFHLPPSLQCESDEAALEQLHVYYGPQFGDKGYFTGAAFDGWDSNGSHTEDADRFTADDLVAVTFLSVRVMATGAYWLLGPRAEQYNALLEAIGDDRDFADVDGQCITPDLPAWTLGTELRKLPGVGRTIASKLTARKRPRLVPIYDKVLRQVMGLQDGHWQPLNAALRAEGQALQKRLLELRAVANLPESISALRVLDVIAWRDGKDAGL
jgi:Family of unknown function (DUF6308)